MIVHQSTKRLSESFVMRTVFIKATCRKAALEIYTEQVCSGYGGDMDFEYGTEPFYDGWHNPSKSYRISQFHGLNH